MEALHKAILHAIHTCDYPYITSYIAKDAHVNVIIYSFKMARLSGESKKRVMLLHLLYLFPISL